MTNGTGSGAGSSEVQIQVESGFSDANFNVGCQVHDNNFGVIRFKNVTKLGSKSNPMATIVVNETDNIKSVFVNVFLNGGYNGACYAHAAILDTSGKVIAQGLGGNFSLSFKAVPGEYYYLVWAGCPTYLVIRGLGYGGTVKQGARGWVTITLDANDEDTTNGYDPTNSTLPPTVVMTFHFQGLPTILGTDNEYLVIGTSDIGTEETVEAKFPANSDGNRYVCDQQLNAQVQVWNNGFYGKSDIFEEAKLVLVIGGTEYITVDLLATSAGSTPVAVGEAVLPSGSYSDAGFKLAVKAKSIPQSEGFSVNANMLLWYDSGYSSLCQ